MELSERKDKILCMAVEDYIRDCAPITSGAIKDITSLSCSTATLRNELNALEAMGYLRQLHTSGGRVPTAKGYRYYVERLLQGVSANNGELEKVRELITSRTTSLSEIVSGIAKIVSQATKYPTVVMMDGYEELILKDFKFIPLLENKVMVLIGTVAGYINDTLNIQAGLKECEDASAYLTKNFRGETIGFLIENIAEIQKGMTGEIAAFQTIVDSLVGGLRKLNHQKLIDIRREGTVKLLEGSSSVEEAKELLKILDDEEELSSALKMESDSEIEVTVAQEIEGKNCSVVKAPITLNGKHLASIGVIGPQRMDYSAIASALKVVIDELKSLKGE